MKKQKYSTLSEQSQTINNLVEWAMLNTGYN